MLILLLDDGLPKIKQIVKAALDIEKSVREKSSASVFC